MTPTIGKNLFLEFCGVPTQGNRTWGRINIVVPDDDKGTALSGNIESECVTGM